MRAKDVMTRDVVTAGPETTVTEIANILLSRHISAVPVVDQDGKVVGLVSEGDLMRRQESGTERRPSWWLALLQRPADRAAEYLKSHGQLARHVMTSPAITMSEDTPLGEIARILEEKRIKRVPIVNEGRLVGIVSRSNLLQGLASTQTRQPSAHSDAEIRDSILKLLTREVGLRVELVNVTVSEGVAHLWGLVATDTVREAAQVATQGLDGVTAVENHLTVMPEQARGKFGGL